jgi:nickel/cobalt transporter (NicO) family protein
MGPWAVRLAVLLGTAATGLVGYAGAATAAADVPRHPVGNETINQSVNLRIQPEQIQIDYVLDVAELPAFSLCEQQFGSAGCHPDPSQAERMAREECDYDAGLMRLALPAGRRPTVRVAGSEVVFLDGSGGLSTFRLTCAFVADLEISAETELTFSNDAYFDTIGIREVTAVGDGTTLVRSSVGSRSPTHRLTAFPMEVLRNPPDVREADLVVRPGGPRLGGSAAPGGNGDTATSSGSDREAPVGSSPWSIDKLSRTFTGFVTHRDLTVAFVIAALLASVGLGAAHAVAPGHGKTMMAAYLVAERGSGRLAVLVGLTVTATHTAGVLILGVVLSATAALAPSRVYPWLGIASGLLVVAVGVGLVRRAWPVHGRAHGDEGHEHTHGHGNEPGHKFWLDHEHPRRPGPRLRSVVGMGIAGGLAPSPSAVVVLLGGIAIGRPWFGVLLVVAYGLGMAVILAGIGFALVRLRDTAARRGRSLRVPGIARALPRLTSIAVVVVGVVLLARSAVVVLA